MEHRSICQYQKCSLAFHFTQLMYD
jgi:hypothetical protein